MHHDRPSVSELDNAHFALLRDHVSELFAVAGRFTATLGPSRVLDIAPQDHGGVAPHLGPQAELTTMDLDPESGADVIGDLCVRNDALKDDSFDAVVCTEVLEHVANPFAAVQELRRVLRPGGRAFLSAPFNFRIHGPLPDNWRFTEHGWRQLLTDFESVEIDVLETPDRFLMPIHYTVVAVK